MPLSWIRELWVAKIRYTRDADDMITEATRKAPAAANRFASDSGSKVGLIRQANQGVFSIIAPQTRGVAWPKAKPAVSSAIAA